MFKIRVVTENTGPDGPPAGWRIGEWTVDPAAGEVRRGAVVRRLEPKVMAVLVALARQPGQVLSKASLLQAVWPDTHVEDVALARSVSEIRRALGDDPRAPRYVETLARRGYRLVAEVRPVSESADAAADVAARPPARHSRAALIAAVLLVAAAGVLAVLLREPAAAPASIEPVSVAVLPFENFGGQPENDYLADGMTEDVIASLAGIEELRVLSRTSTMAYKGQPRNVREIGETLGVRAVLEGSVRRQGDRVVVVAQLIDTTSDEHLWVETIERNVRDLLDVQREIAAQIATALHVRLAAAGAPPPADARPSAEVYDRYLQARTSYEQRGPMPLPEVVAMLEGVTRDAPRFAPGFAALGDAYARTFQTSRAVADVEAAVRAAERALELEPDLAEGWKAHGLAHAVMGRYARAAESYERAVARRPSYWQAINNLAIVFNNTGQHGRAYRWMREAVLLDPARASTRANFGELLRAMGLDVEARAWLESALTVDPHDAGAVDGLAALDIAAGAYDAARRRLEDALAATGDCRLCHLRLAFLAQVEGRDDEATAHITRLLATPGSRTRARLWQARIRRDAGPATGDPDLDLVALTQEFRIYVRDGDESGFSRWALAMAASIQGRTEDAIDWYTRAVDAGHWDVRADEREPAFDPVRNDPRFQVQMQRIRDRAAEARAGVTQVMRPGTR